MLPGAKAVVAQAFPSAVPHIAGRHRGDAVFGARRTRTSLREVFPGRLGPDKALRSEPAIANRTGACVPPMISKARRRSRTGSSPRSVRPTVKARLPDAPGRASPSISAVIRTAAVCACMVLPKPRSSSSGTDPRLPRLGRQPRGLPARPDVRGGPTCGTPLFPCGYGGAVGARCVRLGKLGRGRARAPGAPHDRRGLRKAPGTHRPPARRGQDGPARHPSYVHLRRKSGCRLPRVGNR